MDDVKAGRWGSTGATDASGNPVGNMSDAVNIPYALCVKACGPYVASFRWSQFFQQFSTWLLPWFALASQLPYGGRFNRDNVLSIALTIGSPALAGYSLALTALNFHWIARRFDGLTYPNSRHAAYVLASLQYMPIELTIDDCLLASLVVLPENDRWWKQMADQLNYATRWTTVATFNMCWVLLPYALTVTTSLTDFITSTEDTGVIVGQSVGSAWFWMIALVAGWQWVSPKCDFRRIRGILAQANDIAYVATTNGITLASDVSTQRAISLRERYQGSLLSAQERSPPVFNYDRFLSWVQVLEDVRSAFYVASKKAGGHHAVRADFDWIGGGSTEIDPANRTGCMEEVEAYCRAPEYVRKSRWGPDVVSRIFIASLVGLALQWCTVGAAIVLVWFTPTRGTVSFSVFTCFTGGLMHIRRTWLPFWVLYPICILGYSRVGYASQLQLTRALCDIGDNPATLAVRKAYEVVLDSPSTHGQLPRYLQCNSDHRHVAASIQWCNEQLLLQQ